MRYKGPGKQGLNYFTNDLKFKSWGKRGRGRGIHNMKAWLKVSPLIHHMRGGVKKVRNVSTGGNYAPSNRKGQTEGGSGPAVWSYSFGRVLKKGRYRGLSNWGARQSIFQDILNYLVSEHSARRIHIHLRVKFLYFMKKYVAEGSIKKYDKIVEKISGEKTTIKWLTFLNIFLIGNYVNICIPESELH